MVIKRVLFFAIMLFFAALSAQETAQPDQSVESKSTMEAYGFAFSGMLDVREEIIYQRWNFKQTDEESIPRLRERMKWKFHINKKFGDDFDLNFRFGTHSGKANTDTIVVTDAFKKETMGILIMSATWHPSDILGLGLPLHGLEVTVGKMATPFKKPGKSKLIWSGDLSMNGLHTGYNFDLDFGPKLNLFVNAGYFMLEEIKLDFDPLLITVQAGGTLDLGVVKSTLGFSYFNYFNLGNATEMFGGNSYGNSYIIGADIFAVDYDLFEVFTENKLNVIPLPINIYGHFVMNMADMYEDSDRYAFLAGAKFGELKKQFDFYGDLNFRMIGKDAVIGAFSDSAFGGGGTNAMGLALSVGIELWRKQAMAVDVKLSYYGALKTLTAEDNNTIYGYVEEDFYYHRYHFDFIFKY